MLDPTIKKFIAQCTVGIHVIPELPSPRLAVMTGNRVAYIGAPGEDRPYAAQKTVR